MATDTWNQQPEPQRSGGCLKGCLIVMGIIFLLLIVIAVVMFIFRRSIAANFFYEGMAMQIDASSFSAEEKVEAKAELARFRDAFKNEEISFEDVGRALTEFMNSPAFTMVLASSIENQYLDGSGLGDEEKTAGRNTIRRFAYGIGMKQMDAERAQAVMRNLGTQDPRGQFKMKQSVTDDELRAFLADAKQAADETQVPDVPPEIDLSAEIKRAVDAALDEPVAEPLPPAEGPPADAAAVPDAEP